MNAVPEETKTVINSVWLNLRFHRNGDSYWVSKDDKEFARRRKGRMFQEDKQYTPKQSYHNTAP